MPPAVEYARRLIEGIDHLDGHGFLTSLYFANLHSLILIVMYWLALKNWRSINSYYLLKLLLPWLVSILLTSIVSNLLNKLVCNKVSIQKALFFIIN